MRVYSDDPEEVSAYAKATVGAYRAERVFSAPRTSRLGATDQSTQDGPATVGLGLDELRQRDLIPFEAAIDAGVPVMIGSALYPFSDFTVPPRSEPGGHTAPEARPALQGRGHDGRPCRPGHHHARDRARRGGQGAPRRRGHALHLGAAGDQQAAYIAVLRAVQRGRIPRRRLDEAIGRILLAKQDYRLIR